MQLRSSTAKRRENKGDRVSNMQQHAYDTPQGPLSPNHSEDEHVTPIMQQGKVSKTKNERENEI